MARRAPRVFQTGDKIEFLHRPGRVAKITKVWKPDEAAKEFPNGIIGAAKPPYIDGVVEVSFVELDAFGRECPKEIAAGTSVRSSIDRITKSSNLTVAPGSLVLKVAEFLCTKKVYERVFLQAVLDMREEYNEALSSGRKRKARWVLIRDYIALAWTVTLQVFVSVPVKIIKTLWS